MRIGYEAMLPGRYDTGVEVAVREGLAALVARCPEDQFVVFSHPGAIARLPRRKNVHYVLSRMAGRGRPFRILWQQVLNPRAIGRTELDVYHAPGYIVSPHLSVPAVVTVYDTIALERPELTTRKNAVHYRWAVRRGIHQASGVIVPSEHVKKRLIALAGLCASKVHVVPLGVSSRFKPSRNGEASGRIGITLGIDCPEYVLFVGNTERKKDLPSLIQAFAEWKRSSGRATKLVIAGQPGDDANRVAGLIGESGLRGDVMLTGYVDDETLVALYGAALVFAYPSLEEGFGLPPLEAMACGTPVIASDIGALRETTGGNALLVGAGDIRAWSEAIEMLTSSTAAREELVHRGLRHVAAYTWERSAAATRCVYGEVAGEPSRRVPVGMGAGR